MPLSKGHLHPHTGILQKKMKLDKRAQRALIRSLECQCLQPSSVTSTIQCNIVYSKRLSASLHRTLYVLIDRHPRNISANLFQNPANSFREQAYLPLIRLCKTTEPKAGAILTPGI